jgi:hypothetical protein
MRQILSLVFLLLNLKKGNPEQIKGNRIGIVVISEEMSRAALLESRQKI